MDMQLELDLAQVVPPTRPEEDDRRARVRQIAEPAAWTDSMCMALSEGNNGRKWHTLIDKVHKKAVLELAADKVLANKGSAGVDRQSTSDFENRRDENLEHLRTGLMNGKYHPSPIRRVEIPKAGGGKRPLGIPTIRDRVVQAATKLVLEPIFEIDFAEHSYGFRPGRGAKDALRRVDMLLKDGYTFVVDADLKGYFDSIPHDLIMDRLGDKVSDGGIHALVRQFLTQPVETPNGHQSPTKGTPQGGVLSPLLANMVLDPLDKLIQMAGYQMTRYADDFVIQCRSAAEAASAMSLVENWVHEMGLELHPDKTKIADLDAGGNFEFLGYHFQRTKTGRLRRYVRRKSRQKFRDKVRSLTFRQRSGSLSDIVGELNVFLEGWFEYFKHASYTNLRDADQFIRRRLRRLIRRRNGKRGGTGQNSDDHLNMPNHFFEELGLYSTLTAHREIMRPLRR